MKRKLEQEDSIGGANNTAKRRVSSSKSQTTWSSFRPDLFEPQVLGSFQSAYKTSKPYPHAVVSSLIDPLLLETVRGEITTHISFTLKETDIYRIHQSGDLANLSHLEDDSLKRLPSLVKLRDALYSYDFREWIAQVTGAGKLSGVKTDMAVNVYTPGSYLLCHDDVIGSRRVSYILYLTDPKEPWQAAWGGGLRLYPTEQRTNNKGEEVQVPLPEDTLNIPPAFNQMSFFAVRPGESYHDVEEVYHSEHKKLDGRRIRMAISGWYHIPQQGEDGYEEGAEEAQAQKSSLAQLQGAADEFDEPHISFRHFDEPRVVATSDAKSKEVDPGDDGDLDEDILTEQDLTFLLEYISPSFLTPDMTEKLATSFTENSFLQLEKFLRDAFSERLRSQVNVMDRQPLNDGDTATTWKTARPPHKNRYHYLQNPSTQMQDSVSPISQLLIDLLRSHAFKKWLALITGLRAPSLIRQSVLARRFRRGKDYALASSYQGDQPRLEFTIGMTPSSGWDADETEIRQQSRSKKNQNNGGTNGHVMVETSTGLEFGGEEVYMAGDDDDDESVHSKSLPYVGKKADPAIYRSGNDDEDDGILFTNPATWNQFSVVLRDKGTLRFVKYVSQAASGDRWDIKGEVELADDAFDDVEEASNDGGDDEDEEEEAEGPEDFEEEEEDE